MRCSCDIINELFIDGDKQTVKHAVCGGSLGSVKDITLERMVKPELDEYEGSQLPDYWAQAEEGFHRIED